MAVVASVLAVFVDAEASKSEHESSGEGVFSRARVLDDSASTYASLRFITLPSSCLNRGP